MKFIKCILLRVIILFFGLWLFPFPLNDIPYLDAFGEIIQKNINDVVVWFGNSILQLENVNPQTTGSGDKLHDYVKLLFVLLVSLVGTLVWVLFRKPSKNCSMQSPLGYWFFVYLRYYLTVVMLGYGFAKVFVLQFSEPSFARFITNYGDYSPMGLVWTFMGHSKGYTILSGALEIIGGILLCHKRTVNLGCLILLVVMGNVFPLNVFYDIPVKLYALRYFSVALLLLLPNIGSILKVILGYDHIITKDFFQPISNKKWFIVSRVLKWSFVLLFSIQAFSMNYRRFREFGYLALKPELYGLYEVKEYRKNGRVIPPLLTDSLQIRYIAIDRKTYATLFDMKKNKIFYRMKKDSITQMISLVNFRDTTDLYRFKVKEVDSIYMFEGLHNDDEIKLKTKRLGKEDFLINQRPLKWIQERPYNR